MLAHKRRSTVQKRLPAQTPMLLQEELWQRSYQANLAVKLGPHLQSLNHQRRGRLTGPFVGTQMDSSMPTGSSWPGYRGLTGSAPTASQSSGLKQSNSSLRATGSLRPTVQVSLSPFSGKASARRVSKEDVGLLIVLGCVIGIFL